MPALVIDGHPDPDSLSAALAAAYASAHGDARLIALRDLDFDIHLRWGYTRRMELEPDLTDAWSAILDADRVVVVAPIWWGSTPALLKGFFDRILLPQRAYRYGRSGLPEGLLRGRAGRLVMTTDSPWWYLAATFTPAVRQVRDLTLRFVGLRTPRATILGPVRSSDADRRRRWLARVERIAVGDARRDGGGPRGPELRDVTDQTGTRSVSSS